MKDLSSAIILMRALFENSSATRSAKKHCASSTLTTKKLGLIESMKFLFENLLSLVALFSVLLNRDSLLGSRPVR